MDLDTDDSHVMLKKKKKSQTKNVRHYAPEVV